MPKYDNNGPCKCNHVTCEMSLDFSELTFLNIVYEISKHGKIFKI